MKYTDLIILGLLLAVFLFFKGRDLAARHRLRAAAGKTARGGSAAARDLLLAKGYLIEDVNQRLEYRALINGRPYKGHLQADFMVIKEGRRLAARVESSGEQAVLLTKAEGRWQLLQFQVLARTAGVAVVDLENQKIHEISFKIIYPLRQKLYFLICFLSGALAGAAAFLFLYIY